MAAPVAAGVAAFVAAVDMQEAACRVAVVVLPAGECRERAADMPPAGASPAARRSAAPGQLSRPLWPAERGVALRPFPAALWVVSVDRELALAAAALRRFPLDQVLAIALGLITGQASTTGRGSAIDLALTTGRGSAIALGLITGQASTTGRGSATDLEGRECPTCPPTST